MKIRYFQKGFNYSQDGPGNRLIYHLQGCNMHCPWCSNPEGIPKKAPLMQIPDELPEFICPNEAIVLGRLDRTICEECNDRKCIKDNINEYLVCKNFETDIDQIVEEAKECAGLFFDGGGVTLTGGEIGMQFSEVKELLKKLHGSGIHTAVETNATHPHLEEIFSFTDFLIADYKHYNSEKLKAVTGIGNELIGFNICKALDFGKKMLIRILLVSGFNASPDDIEGFLDFFISLRRDFAESDLSVEVLEYHEYGKKKWEQCGLEYICKNAFVEKAIIEQFEESLKRVGVNIVRT